MSPGQPEALTERCELQAGSTVRGDIESPRLTVDDNVTFVAAQRSGRGSHSRPDVRLPIHVYAGAGNVIERHESHRPIALQIFRELNLAVSVEGV